jgi:hypothetical protein
MLKCLKVSGSLFYFILFYFSIVVVVETLFYKPEDRGFETQ